MTKHGVKQVDRLLSNRGVDVWTFFAYWTPFIVGARTEVIVALDWTNFAADGQDTIVLSMVTGHGRATPLLWKTVASSTLKGNQRRYEYEVLCRLREVLPAGVKVTVVADRGFADCKLFYALTTELAFEYVIRLRGDIYVTSAGGERRTAAAWVGAGGHARRLVGARVTDTYELPVGAVVCVQDPKMDEPWCLVASEAKVPTRVLIRYYGKRWGIEAGFRDIKDMRLGHSPVHPRARDGAGVRRHRGDRSEPGRRDGGEGSAEPWFSPPTIGTMTMRSASSRSAGRPARSSDLRGRVLAGTTSRLMRGTLGYSFVELLVVSSILLILASAVAPLAQVTMQRQREIELRRALREMRTAIDGYKYAVDLGVHRRHGDRSGKPGLSAQPRNARGGRRAGRRERGQRPALPAADSDRSDDEDHRLGHEVLPGRSRHHTLGRGQRVRRLHEIARHGARRHALPGLVRRCGTGGARTAGRSSS